VREVGIEEGDRVLVKNLRERGGTGKLRSTWEHQIFEVVRQQGELPVYHVRNLDKPRDVRVLHRNHLMKCDELPLDVFKDEMKNEKNKEKAKKPKETSKKKKEPKRKDEAEVVRDESNQADSDEEGEYHMVIYPDEMEEDSGVQRDETDGQNDQLVVEEPILVSPDVIEALDDSVAEEFAGEESGIEHQTEDMEEAEDEDESEDEAPARRSTRQKAIKKTFTFDKLGGNPSYKEAT
jgi:hypothetical protein